MFDVCTNSVVAIMVFDVPETAVGANGAPANVGDVFNTAASVPVILLI